MDSWQELTNPRDLTKIFTTPEYAAWRSLRESDDAKYVGLTMPRFLARLPYGSKTDPVEDFDFEEALREMHVELKDLNQETIVLAEKIQEKFEELGV